MKNRIMYNMPFGDYTEVSGVHSSTLKEILTSPKHYKYAINSKKKSTSEMIRGHLSHTAVLEYELLDEKYALWDGGRRYGKKYDEFLLEIGDKTDIKPQELEDALEIKKAVDNSISSDIFSKKNKKEVSMFWTEKGIDCKCRIDCLVLDGELVGIWDLKSTYNVTKYRFERTFNNFRYDVQAGMYRSGVKHCLGEDLPFGIVAVESRAPHDVAVFRCDDELTEYCDEQYQTALDKLLECRENDHWPGQYQDMQYLDMLPWNRTDDDFFDIGELEE